MSDILTGFNMQGNDPIDDRIVSKSNLETLEQYLNRVPVQKRYYGLTFFALDKNNELRKYTFQTSLIEPTIDDNEEEIERIDKELQEHVSNKAIHKTSEEIRSEIVDADIPDTIARVQWTLDQINTAVINLIGGASDEYNTLKRIQTKIEELRAEMESQLYGDDGGTVLKTLEQALKFLNQYKDFIVDIPDNFVSKQDIVDNLTTDDPTKVLSAKQGKILSDTLTNYFESAMQSIRTETDRAINAENRIEAKLDKEIERSTNEDIRIDNKLDSEINRSTAEDDRLDKKIDAETTRATTAESNLNTKIETETDRAEGEESRIETKLDNEITRSTNKDTEHDNRLQALEGQTHEQNTDLGTTNSTFQLKYNTGNKIKHESDAISVRNAADTDYVNFIAKNATFKGDLLVEGQSFVTEAETVEIKDNLLLLNKGEVGAGVTKGIAGLEIDRGTEPNYFIVFDESDNRFKAGVEGDLWNLALRESDDNMLDGYFISWNSKDKILSTTNIVNESTPLLFGRTDYKRYSGDIVYQENVYSSYSFIDETPQGTLYNSAGESNWNIDTTKSNFRFWKPILGTTFKRTSDNSEVLYHADIVNNLTSGGTNKVLSAEQGKLLQNSITNIQGSYLPLSGGTMTGSIIFPNRKGIFGRLTNGTGNIKIAVVNANNNVEIGDSNIPLMLVSNDTDLTHYRNNNTYKIWDKFNLSDPATLSGNNTFTGNNTFQAGKFNVGPFKVTSSGSLLSNISSPAGSAWSRSLVFRVNNDIPSSLNFGGYNSVDNTSIGYAYIGIGDINYQTAQYKFYANSLRVPYQWSIDGPDGAAIIWSQTSEIVNLGRAAGTTKIRSGNTDLIHTKGSTEYIIWDKSNLPNPASTTDLNNYLPLTGGVLSGTLTINTVGSTTLVINNNDTNGSETFMRVLRKGTPQAAIGFKDGLGAYIYNYNSSKYLFIADDGYARVGTTSGSTRLALITDIPSISGYLPLSGGTMTGALTMSSRRHNVVVDVVGGAGQTWDEGAGALSIQVPNDAGQTPLILARRSGAAIDTTVATERLLSMELLDTGHSFIIGMSGSEALQLDWTSGRVGTGKLFGKTIATTDQIPSLSGYATQSWANSQFAPLKNYFVTSNYASIATTGNEMCIGSLTSGNSIINVNYRNGTGTTSPSTWYWRAGSSTSWANAYWGNLYMNDNLVATQTWSNSQYPLKTGTGASGTWDINISGNASTASAASKLGSTTIGGSAKPIYLSSGTPTACSATVGSATVPVYMNAGTITQCSTTLGVSITGNAATATNATQLGGTAASSYVKANDNISRLTNDSGYTTQEWVNGQGFLTSDSILDKFVPTTGGYIRNSDQVLLRLQRTGVSTGTSRTIEMYFDDSNTDGTSTTPRGSIGYNSEVGMFLYSAKSKKFLAIENTGRPFYGTPENRYYLLGSNTQYHNLDGYQRIGDIMIQWGYFTVQGNSTRAVNFPVSFTNTVWSVTGSWDNTTTGNQENWGFTDYTSSGFTIINGDGSSRVFHYIAIGPFTRS